VFHRGQIIGYVVTCCHHVDIGGRRATIESRDNYEEGLRIPHLKIFRAGQLNTDVLAFIENNVRSAKTVIGDLRAQFAANHVGCERMRGICEERDWTNLQLVSNEVISRSETLARAEIKKIPDGIYTREIIKVIDTGDEVKICCKITVEGGTLEIDYGGSSPQIKQAVNCTLTYASSYTMFTVNALLDLPVSMNQGTLAPITIKADEGTIFNCTFPAPTFGRTSIGLYLSEVIFETIAEALPERICAGAGSTPMWGQYLFGKKKNGDVFAPLNCVNGGLGARADRDGVSCLSFPVNVGNTPMEVLENDLPILVRRRALWPDSAGAGKFRGGFGQIFEVEILDGDIGPDGDVLTSFRAGRFVLPVPGFLGGFEAPVAKLTVNGIPQITGSQVSLKAGDRYVCSIPGGGGLGDPKERDRDLIDRDLENGLVSPEFAKKHYGYSKDAAE
jgi:N-methylhydantoinase B